MKLALASVLVFYGVIDFIDQLKTSRALEWGLPIMLILLGSGPISLIIFLPDDISEPTDEEDIANDREFSSSNDSGMNGGGGDGE